MRRTTLVSVLLGGVLILVITSCGGGSATANGERAASSRSSNDAGIVSVTVTDAEAKAFGAKAQAVVPTLGDAVGKDFGALDQAICESFAAGQRYPDVSNTVALFTSLPLGSADVDKIISAAVTTSCSKLEGRKLGDGSTLKLRS